MAALLPVVLTVSALAASQPAVTPADQMASQPDSIVVTGIRPTRNAIYRFVDELTVPVEGQIARFTQPICPATFGLPDAYNRVVEQRLRDDSLRVGIRLADGHCDANVVVIVADDPARLVAKLQRERPQIFVGLEFNQIQDVLRTNEPVRTWQAIEPRGFDGRPLRRVMFIYSSDGPPRPVGGSGAWVNPAASNSRITQNIRPDIVASFVVIDADAVDGLTLTQIADYAAMRALVRTRITPGLKERSILGVLDGNDSIDQLTEWDLAYLRALYRTSNTLSAHTQQSAIAGAMKRELDKPNTGTP